MNLGADVLGIVLAGGEGKRLMPLTAALGPGGAGMGVAMALSARELVTVIVFAGVIIGSAAGTAAGAVVLGVATVSLRAPHRQAGAPEPTLAQPRTK